MRVFTLDFPEKPPGKCSLCGANHRRDGRQYFDFGLSVPRYGVVYLCTVCLTEIANWLNWANPMQVNEMKAAFEAATKELIDMRVENDGLRRALSELDFLSSNKSSDTSSVESSQGITDDEEPTDTTPSGTTGKAGKSKSRSSKSVDESGSSDIFRLDLSESI
jgi:hypothetical protein